MIQRGERLGFAAEPGHTLGVVREGFGNELERDAPAEARVGRLVDVAHTTRAQMCRDLVVA